MAHASRAGTTPKVKGRSLTIDIEHFAKVWLLGEIESAGEDGYGIVEDFLDANHSVEKEIDRGKSSVYIDGLLSRYSRPDFPCGRSWK